MPRGRSTCIGSCDVSSARRTCSSSRSWNSRASRRPLRRSGIQRRCPGWAIRAAIRTIRIRSSRPGPLSPRNTAHSSARSGTSGRRATSARCWSTSVRRWSRKTWGCRRRSVCTASSAARASRWSTTGMRTAATITSIRSTGSATFANARSERWCSPRTRCALVTPSRRRCLPTANSAHSSETAGANARRTGCYEPLKVSRG